MLADEADKLSGAGKRCDAPQGRALYRFACGAREVTVLTQEKATSSRASQGEHCSPT